MTVDNRLNMVVASTEVILKWQQYGSHCHISPFPTPVEDVF